MSLLQNKKKIEEDEKKDYEKRLKPFLEEYKKLTEKHQLEFMPVLNYTAQGINVEVKVLNKVKSSIKQIKE